MSVPDSDLYPTLTYRDPLVFPTHLRTNDVHSTWTQVTQDWLLDAYVGRIDNEICSDIPEFVDHKPLVKEIFDKTRALGFCVVQPYNDESYRVYSPIEWSKWLTEQDADGKLTRVGMAVNYYDDLGNNYFEEIYFDDRPQHGYLFIWEQGNGIVQANSCMFSAFAIADINPSILKQSIKCRLIDDALMQSAVKPYFYHLVYGENITPAQRTSLIEKMSYIGPSNGLGAKLSTLMEIRPIENGAVEKSILALDEGIRFYSSITRLPYEYYMAEKMTGGLGDTGQVEDDNEVEKKKGFILSHMQEPLKVFWSEMGWGDLGDLGQYYIEKAQEKADKAVEDQKAIKGTDKNEGN